MVIKIWIPVMILLLLTAGCEAKASATTTPATTAPVTTASVTTASATTAPATTAPATTADVTKRPIPWDTDDDFLLARAVDKLWDAPGYNLKVTTIRSYTGDYGLMNVRSYTESIDDIRVQNHPDQRVEILHNNRPSRNGDFSSKQVYEYQQGDGYYRKTIDGQGRWTVKKNRKETFPQNNDVLNILSNRYSLAKFIEEKDGMALYTLTLGEWYMLESAALFADMGSLYTEDHARTEIGKYVREHYPDAAPIVLNIEVSTASGNLRKVTVDDRAFLMSMWDMVSKEAPYGKGPHLEDLLEFKIMPEHGTCYIFSNWNHAGDIEIPE